MLYSKQDVKLREAVALYKDEEIRGGIRWEQVASHMGGTRSFRHCYVRWRETLKVFDSAFIKEGAWTDDEVIRYPHATIVLVKYCLYSVSILYIYPLHNNSQNYNIKLNTGHNVA